VEDVLSIPSLIVMDSITSLRRQIRAQRRVLSAIERQQAAARAAEHSAASQWFTDAQHIAAYLAFDGEMDPIALIQHVWKQGKQIYLPMLIGTPPNRLSFAPYQPDTVLRPNRFGIPEPAVAASHWLPPSKLDLVFAPLVAFDATGTRLGMGGGFYDRTFAFRRQPPHPVKPRLLGLAYELQKVPVLERRPWDVPLDAVVTEAGLYFFPA